MAKTDQARIAFILAEIAVIEKATAEKGLVDFLADEVLQHAVAMSFINIGESIHHFSDDFYEKHSTIEWHEIVALRNIAAHGYHELNMEQIWETIVSDIPRLKNYLLNI